MFSDLTFISVLLKKCGEQAQSLGYSESEYSECPGFAERNCLIFGHSDVSLAIVTIFGVRFGLTYSDSNREHSVLSTEALPIELYVINCNAILE